MRSIKRLRERLLPLALVAGAPLATAGAAMSCAKDDASPAPPAADGAADDVTATDASFADAKVVPHDAETSDAGARPVVCSGTDACATALVGLLQDTFCALLSDGTVACWGHNDTYGLGRGADAGNDDSANAARVVGLKNIVSIGRSCAVDRDGGAYGWGLGPWLQDPTQLETTEPVPVKLPIPAATAIDARVHFDTAVACAAVEGGAMCWGQNTNAQAAAIEAGVDTSLPVAPSLVPLPPGAKAAGIAVGDATFVVRADGTALSWGANPPLARTSSLFPDPYPGLLELRGVTSVDSVILNAAATAQGIAYMWGYKDDNDVNPVRVPAPLVTSEPVVRISTTDGIGSTDDPQRACMVGISGDVFCYGANNTGQVGNGTKDYQMSPVKVIGLPAPAADVKTTSRTTCALLTTGKVYCWGDDTYGQLGSGKIKVPTTSPGEVKLP